MDGHALSINQGLLGDLQGPLPPSWPRETLGFGLCRPRTIHPRTPDAPSPAPRPGGLPGGGKPGRMGTLALSSPPPTLSLAGTAGQLLGPRPAPAGPHLPAGRGLRVHPGMVPPRTPTCRPRVRSARPASPRPAARCQCAGAAADASVCVRARRWRRRGRQREQSGERRSSLKRAAMADRSPQVAAGPRPRREGAPSGARAGGRTPAPRERVGVGEGAGTRCPGLGPAPPAAAAPRPPARGEQREGLWGRAQWAWGAKG